MSTRIPDHWQKAMESTGLTSYRKLAEAADLSVETVRAAILGQRRSVAPATITGLSKALRLPEETISEYLGMGRQSITPYTPPQEAAMLTRRERDHVDELIRLLVASRSKPFVLGESRLDEATLKDEDMLTDDDRGYIATAEAKLQAVLQGDYTAAAREHEEGE
ncbi:hypothetical protein [Trueperella pyogenes]|uniref:hypothetical protein n=1 Tax=Trueperella pyogenes TaxID=1661 RepID=UPI0023DDAE74|nr:hypothetical protein [Trueperella pyogenes]